MTLQDVVTSTSCWAERSPGVQICRGREEAEGDRFEVLLGIYRLRQVDIHAHLLKVVPSDPL